MPTRMLVPRVVNGLFIRRMPVTVVATKEPTATYMPNGSMLTDMNPR